MSGGEALDRAGRRPIAADSRRRATVRGSPNESTRPRAAAGPPGARPLDFRRWLLSVMIGPSLARALEPRVRPWTRPQCRGVSWSSLTSSVFQPTWVVSALSRSRLQGFSRDRRRSFGVGQRAGGLGAIDVAAGAGAGVAAGGVVSAGPSPTRETSFPGRNEWR